MGSSRLLIILLTAVCLQACGAGSSKGLVPTTSLSEALPIQTFAKVNMTTVGGVAIASKDTYVDGQFTIDPNGLDASLAFTGSMKIKGRGNSTWLFPKKPYKIKLNSTAVIMGMPTDKEWVLLANYSDKTLMRNEIAMEMGRRLGMAYVPRTQTVEVNLNSTDLGTYVLTEQVKISTTRVNAVSTDVTGGYLIEIDQRRDQTYRFETTTSEPYAIKEPSVPTAPQLAYIQGYVQDAEDALNSAGFENPTTGYAGYIDVDSFIDWYLVNETLQNSDAGNYSSIYFYKSSGGKLKMGPLWDFDISIGNNDYTNAQYTTGWWIRTQSPWFSRLFQDPVFASRVKARWNQMRALSSDLTAVNKMIDRNAYAFDLVQRTNFFLWDILGIYVWPNRVVTGSYAGEVAAMKTWITARMQWMDQQFNP